MSKKNKEKKRQARSAKKASSKYAEFDRGKEERIKKRAEAVTRMKDDGEQVQSQEEVDMCIRRMYYGKPKRK